jgi:hypothetical protein
MQRQPCLRKQAFSLSSSLPRMFCIVNARCMAPGQGHRVASLHAAALVRNQPAKLMALNFSTVVGSIARTLSACSMAATPPADVPVSKTCLASPRPRPISSRTSDASTRRPPVQCQTLGMEWRLGCVGQFKTGGVRKWRLVSPTMTGSCTSPEKLAPSQYFSTALWKPWKVGFLAASVFKMPAWSMCFHPVDVPLDILLRTLHASGSVHQPPPSRCSSQESLRPPNNGGGL